MAENWKHPFDAGFPELVGVSCNICNMPRGSFQHMMSGVFVNDARLYFMHPFMLSLGNTCQCNLPKNHAIHGGEE